MMFNQEERTELLQIARQTLETYLRNHTFQPISPRNERLKEKGGAFVTLENRADPAASSLRG